jgi:hypothetical protein
MTPQDSIFLFSEENMRDLPLEEVLCYIRGYAKMLDRASRNQPARKWIPRLAELLRATDQLLNRMRQETDG